MVDQRRERLQDLLASGRAALRPLALTQRELWEAAPFPPEDASNHIGALIFVRGPVTSGLLQTALAQVAARQEVLRLAIVRGKQQPVQFIREEVPALVRVTTPAKTDDQAIEALSEALFREPIELARAPLYRMHVIQRATDDYVLVLSIHHAVADGWSVGLFVVDLARAFMDLAAGRAAGLPAVELTYTNWAAAERASWTPALLQERGAFWRSRLRSAPRLLGGAPGRSDRASLPSPIPDDLAAAVRSVAQRSGTTPYSTLLAAFQLTMSTLTGGTDILVGTPVANRNRRAAAETMGSFAGIVPMRGEVDPGRPFRDHLAGVHRMCVESFAQAMPFVELVAAVGVPVVSGQNPVFDVRFAFQNFPVPEIVVPGLSMRFKLLSTGTARFDLACEIAEQADSLEVTWRYRSDLFTDRGIGELDRLFRTTLTECCRSIVA